MESVLIEKCYVLMETLLPFKWIAFIKGNNDCEWKVLIFFIQQKYFESNKRGMKKRWIVPFDVSAGIFK
jgi:hypothetical protein